MMYCIYCLPKLHLQYQLTDQCSYCLCAEVHVAATELVECQLQLAVANSSWLTLTVLKINHLQSEIKRKTHYLFWSWISITRAHRISRCPLSMFIQNTTAN